MNAAPARRGFTLVELLVVTGLMASLLGLVVLGMQPSGNSQVRQLSQALSSAILAAQTRALGNDAGAALILDVTSPNSYSNTVFNADVPPFMLGGTATGVTSGTYGMPPMSGITGTLTLSATASVVTLSLTNSDTTDLINGYKIRFYCDSPSTPPSPWFQFNALPNSASGTVSLRGSANQTINNTIWPSPSGTGTLMAQIARFPVKSTAALDTTRRAAVDLRYSGVGNTTSGDYGTLDGKGPIAITFDRNGGLDMVMQYGTAATPTVAPITATVPVYFLIASIDDIQNNQSLQSQNSRWLAINPSTGRASVGANVSVTGTTQTDINNARANARQGLTGGVK